MRSLREAGGIGLAWSEIDFHGHHQLLRVGEVVATMAVSQGPRGIMGEAVTADGGWVFGPRGFFRRHIAIQSGGVDYGRYQPSAEKRSGRLEVPALPPYSWSRVDWPHLHWTFMDADGLEALCFTGSPKSQRIHSLLTARVDINPAALQRPETPLLVMLCGYLVVKGDDAPVVKLEDPDLSFHDLIQSFKSELPF